MDIKLNASVKSLDPFEWKNIPTLTVLTGTNGSGKTQLLKLLYDTLHHPNSTPTNLIVSNFPVRPDEVRFHSGEWQLSNTAHVTLASLQQRKQQFYDLFHEGGIHEFGGQPYLFYAFQEIEKKAGKERRLITKEQFEELFPDSFYDNEPSITEQIGSLFYSYRLEEIQLKAEGFTEAQITTKIGQKPWIVLQDIMNAAKLPFRFNDPSTAKILSSFKLQVIHQISGASVEFGDLSSGEKVLISLMFYLYNTQEKNAFPRILIMDEPDAHLHPSMAQQFINVVKEVLVDKYGVRVIFSTHSPSTVILAPLESVFIMSRDTPRVRPAISKNEAVKLLTSGIVYVGEGTKYFLVEDEDDVDFYTAVLDLAIREKLIGADTPLVFIAASSSTKSGGKTVVNDWVKKLLDSGLNEIIYGLIDEDDGNATGANMFKINRYSIENYLADPIVVYAALMDQEKNPQIPGLNLAIGKENILQTLSAKELQKIANIVLKKVETSLTTHFSDMPAPDKRIIVDCIYSDHRVVKFPEWLFNKRGKTIIQQVYNTTFGSNSINFKTLFKAFKRLSLLPQDLIDTFKVLKRL